MSDHNQTSPNAGETNVPATPARSGRRKWLIGGAIGLAGLIGLGAVSAYSQPGWGGHGRYGWHRGFDPATMGPRIDFGVDMILGRVGANEDQKKKVASTIKGIAQQAPDFRKGNMEAREQMLKLLKAEKFDKVELERLRAERIKAIDEASKKVVQALGEVADTLTPKQRQELVELAEKRRRMFGRH
ncbi:MAG: Spy/CpxP family protein refolding chaperone [Beijerinckiaceae bacterium]